MTIAFSRRTAIALGGLGLLGLTRWCRVLAESAPAWRGYARALVIDGLGGPGGGDQKPDERLTALNVADTKQSGITCTHVTLMPVGTTPPDAAMAAAMSDIAWWEREIESHPDVLMRVRTTEDIHEAKRSGRTGIVYGFQDGVAFETDLDRLEVFHQMGVRVIQPTYNRRNLLGDGCLEPANAGLSRAGVEAIERMNDLGILVDLSHCGRQTAADAIRLSKKPVAFTHSGCAGLIDHPRNRTDEELRAVANKGGVTGIYFMPFLSGGKQPTAADVVRHIEHAVSVAGEDHVSLGTDGNISAQVLTPEYAKAFADWARMRIEAGIAAPGESETSYTWADDLNTPRRFETLAGLLSARGYGDRRIEKILGLNLMRVFREVWGK